MSSSFPIHSLQVYKINNKIRIGRNHDGGYVIADGYDYDLLIGCGIKDDDSFEHDFLKKYQNINCLAFDGSVNSIPHTHDRINFFKKFISYKNDNNYTNLHNEINDYNNIFLKMDIEGGEYAWFYTLSHQQINKFKQIVIEIHFPFEEVKWFILDKLASTHYLIHFHGNNCRKTRKINNIEIPDVFECTYIRKDLFNNQLELNEQPIPSSLDMTNHNKKPEIELSGYPYSTIKVNKKIVIKEKKNKKKNKNNKKKKTKKNEKKSIRR